MKKFLVFFASGAVILFLISSCYYDNMEALYPLYNATCDTTNVTYSGTIQPILNDNCLSCHSNPSTGGNIVLTTYDQVVSNSSRITGAIKHQNSFSAMPKNAAMLKSCSINQWDIWVRKGMLND
jgi:hypothetical protein